MIKDALVKGVILDGQARIAVVRTTDLVNEVIRMHNMGPLAAAVLGRTMTVGAYLSHNLKNEKDRFNLIVDGGGPLGKICVAGEGCGFLRGFCENPTLELPLKNGKWDVGGAVGKNGQLTVIKDLGLKEPYVGKSPLVSGEIAEDFAAYLLYSEGIANAVSLGVLTDQAGCSSAGGIFMEVLPGATEEALVILEDIAEVLKGVSEIFKEKSAKEVADFYFAHLNAEIFSPLPIRFRCRCGQKIPDTVRALGKKECLEIIEEQGILEVSCDYCNKKYRYNQEDLSELFGG